MALCCSAVTCAVAALVSVASAIRAKPGAKACGQRCVGNGMMSPFPVLARRKVRRCQVPNAIRQARFVIWKFLSASSIDGAAGFAAVGVSWRAEEFADGDGCR